jgi:hypothetical protein
LVLILNWVFKYGIVGSHFVYGTGGGGGGGIVVVVVVVVV